MIRIQKLSDHNVTICKKKNEQSVKKQSSSVVKSVALRLKKSCYPQVPGSIPAENTSTQIRMDLRK